MATSIHGVLGSAQVFYNRSFATAGTFRTTRDFHMLIAAATNNIHILKSE